MNRHFEDARYHLGRTVSHVAAGLRDEFAPYEGRVRARLGEEPGPERRTVALGYVQRARTDATRYVGDARDVVARRAE